MSLVDCSVDRSTTLVGSYFTTDAIWDYSDLEHENQMKIISVVVVVHPLLSIGNRYWQIEICGHLVYISYYRNSYWVN